MTNPQDEEYLFLLYREVRANAVTRANRLMEKNGWSLEQYIQEVKTAGRENGATETELRGVAALIRNTLHDPSLN